MGNKVTAHIVEHVVVGSYTNKVNVPETLPDALSHTIIDLSIYNKRACEQLTGAQRQENIVINAFKLHKSNTVRIENDGNGYAVITYLDSNGEDHVHYYIELTTARKFALRVLHSAVVDRLLGLS